MSQPVTATVVRVDKVFSSTEALALAGFLAGYSGLTREAYALDLRQFSSFCSEHSLAIFDARRAHIENFARHLESCGRSRATIARRSAPSPASTATPRRRA